HVRVVRVVVVDEREPGVLRVSYALEPAHHRPADIRRDAPPVQAMEPEAPVELRGLHPLDQPMPGEGAEHRVPERRYVVLVVDKAACEAPLGIAVEEIAREPAGGV